MKGKKTKKNQTTNKGEGAIPRILSMGSVDLIMNFEFTEDELIDLELEFDKLNSLTDLKFLEEKKDLWNKFELTSNNPTLITLLYLNKVNKKKSYIDYVPLGLPTFSDEEKYFEEVVKFVTEQNYLNINESQLEEGARYSIIINLKYEENVKQIVLGSPKDSEPKGEEQKEEEKKEEAPKEEEKKEGEEEKKEEAPKEEEKKDEAPKEEAPKEEAPKEEEKKDEAPKEEEKKEDAPKEEEKKEEEKKEDKKEPPKDKTPGIKSEKEKKKEAAKKKAEEKKNNETTEKKEGEEAHPQENNADATKEQPAEGEEGKKEKSDKLPEFTNQDTILAKMDPKCSSYDIIYINFSDILSLSGNFQLLDLIELLVHFKTHSAQSPLIVVNYPEMSDKDEETTCYINSMFYLTDLYYFDFKEATKTFDGHYKTFTIDDPKRDIDKKKTFDYFIKGIATATKPTVEGHKLGLFIDDFNKFSAVEAKGKNADTHSYDSRPYPKVNHNNLELVEAYKNIIKENKEFLMSIFLGGFLGGMAGTCANDRGSAFSGECIYVSFLTGLEIVKRLVEILKNNLPMPTSNDFYQVKISKAKIEEELKKVALSNKEGGFILDCTNAQKSAMKDYVALYDYHLRGFFSSQIIRKDLKDKGFINTNGFIMYDPVYRSVMGASCKNVKPPKDQEELNKKMLCSIKGLNVASNIKQKEVDSKTMVLRSNSPTNMKIPVMKESEYVTMKISKNNTKTKTQMKENKTSSPEEEKKEEEKKEEENKEEEKKEEAEPVAA